MNTKKEGEYYSQMVRRYKNEYGGKNLQEFCIKDKGLQDLENRLAEQQASSDERIRSLTDQLSQEMGKVSSMMQQLVDFMMGKGAVSLSDTLRESVVAGVREEMRKEMRREYQDIIDEKDTRIAALEAMQNSSSGDNHQWQFP